MRVSHYIYSCTPLLLAGLGGYFSAISLPNLIRIGVGTRDHIADTHFSSALELAIAAAFFTTALKMPRSRTTRYRSRKGVPSSDTVFDSTLGQPRQSADDDFNYD
jgi:uncharacterized membrane protein (UPF0136 family)